MLGSRTCLGSRRTYDRWHGRWWPGWGLLGNEAMCDAVQCGGVVWQGAGGGAGSSLLTCVCLV